MVSPRTDFVCNQSLLRDDNRCKDMVVYVHTVNSDEDCKDIVNKIHQLGPPAIAVTCKRAGKGDPCSSFRLGTISWLLIAIEHHCFVFDIKNNPKLVTAGHIKCLLENSVIQKVMHDCKFDSVCLYANHGIQLTNVFDTQAGQAAYDSQVARLSTYAVPPKSIVEVLREHDDTFPFALGKMVYDFEKDSIDVWEQRPLNPTIREYLIHEVCSLLHKTFPFLNKNLHPFKKRAAIKISEMNIIRFIDPEECIRRENERLRKQFEKIAFRAKEDGTMEEDQTSKGHNINMARKRPTPNSPRLSENQQNKRIKKYQEKHRNGVESLPLELSFTDDEECDNVFNEREKSFCSCCSFAEDGDLLIRDKSPTEELEEKSIEEEDPRSCPTPDEIVDAMNKIIELLNSFAEQKENERKECQERNGSVEGKKFCGGCARKSFDGSINCENSANESQQGTFRNNNTDSERLFTESQTNRDRDSALSKTTDSQSQKLVDEEDETNGNKSKNTTRACGKNCPFCIVYGRS